MSLAALKRPFGIKSLLGILLSGFPIIDFFSMGYKLACCRTAMEGNYSLPAWNGWKDLFVHGAAARVLQFIYALPALVTLYFLWSAGKNPISVLITNVGAVRNFFILFLVFLFLAVFLSPAAILNYLTEGRIKDAFSVLMLKRAVTFDYLKSWLIVLVYVSLVLILFFILIYYIGAVNFAGMSYIVLTLLFVFLFILGVTVWTLFGEYWGRVLAKESRVLTE